ncbi:MAG TPA: hypothetical protein VIP11_01945 [Gemmatimonadaceae bacterium]
MEVLLLLHAHSAKAFRAVQVAELARLNEQVATRVLETLVDAGVITSVDGSYRFKASLANTTAVEQLARAYHTRPVTLVQAIYSRPAPVTSFSQALRKRDEEQR